ncbi:ADP-ribose pyrophosphatase [Rhizomicrobium palustre]|uniref:ADP-ribose pyrophosphatase n=1 Tax=Rhizomicrobium palustre TaxID=189966 RepID=A0A846MUP5_9PROT|nr:NUDIX hydrolase [Rhizomicrobium palustre]NIK86955.1 ADP-ribose pyrophosphatase [Rhizomicrobium palustre]
MTKKTKIEKTRLLVDDFFKLEEAYVAFEKKDGEMSKTVRRLDLKRDDAVCALIVNQHKGTVVLVRQFRYAALSRGQAWPLELVAGLIDDGEPAEDAIRREILEEAGYKVGPLQRLFTFYPSPGITSERGILFYGETDGAEPVEAGGGLAEENEDIEIVELPFAEAFAMVESGEIYDGKTLIGLLWLKNKLA